ncbi:MAG TPA: hypothetical protein VFT34_09130 [Verrucomicrobiae bacterium]|nr:hypothetical protein [Verrucomicrobiae bacterium]
MPSSRPNTIPTVIHLLRQLQPRSILDVGVGFGKWGHLFREYTDINAAERDPPRYRRENWQVRIDGIEGHAAYLTELHRYLYNEIHVGDTCELLPKLPNYDLIFMGDIIEHFEKPKGLEFLRMAVAKANKAVIVTTPKFETAQENLCANELERHRSLWSARDFRKLPGALVKTLDRATLLAVIAKPGIGKLLLTPPPAPSAGAALRLAQARDALIELLPLDEPFILVDEEQLRSLLPHRRAMPFLEQDGAYWGPPADDATAISQLERLRAAGARHIVFAWPCFWWLEHYAAFASHLRANYKAAREDALLIAFALAL